jgi:hypothetical protein
MPVSPRLSLLFAPVTILGLSRMVCAHFVNDWNAIAHFARGLMNTAIRLIGTLFLAGITMLRESP